MRVAITLSALAAAFELANATIYLAGDSTMAPKNMKPSNLADAEWTRGSSEGEIFWVIQNGAPPNYDMKGLKGKITDADTWNIVHFVRSLGGAGK